MPAAARKGDQGVPHCSGYTIANGSGDVFINNAQVIVADLLAENGVVHVIDAILLPPVSVNENEAAEISVFPNPATDVLNINIPSLQNGAWYAIFNAQGQVIERKPLLSTRQELNVSSLTSGFYTLQLMNGSSVQTISFAKN